MDGAVVVSTDGSRIVRAAVHLMPDPALPTEESGTRHRTAQRVAQQTGYPVISVSQSMRIVSLYIGEGRYVLESVGELLSRANHAIATLERYKARLDEVSQALSALEIEDLVTVRDAMVVLQRLEMVRRIAAEIEGYVVELGTDGRLLILQLDELMAGVEGERELVVRDYLVSGSGRRQRRIEHALAELDVLTGGDLLDLQVIAKAVGYAATSDALEGAVSPRGYRLLAKVPRLPRLVVDRLVEHFGGLQKLLAAGIDDLQLVEGVGETRARSVREGLSRLAESSILERYV
jgi:diadenylate cyclase